MDLVRKEIREALLGDLVPTRDGRLAVSFTRLAKYRNGLGDGYDKVLIFGVMCRRRWYLSAKNSKKMRELAIRGMQDMGRMMYLSSDPDREAVYCGYLMNTPAVLTYSRGKDGVIEVSCYSARGISGWIACFRTLNAFQKKVPEVLQRMSEEDEQKRRSEIKEWNAADRLKDKQAKKEKKQEKKRLRKEKRKARLQKMVGVLPKLPELPLTDKAGKTSTAGQMDQEAQTVQEETFAQATLEQEVWEAQTERGSEMEPVQETFEQELPEQEAREAFERELPEQEVQEAFERELPEHIRVELDAEQTRLAERAAQAKLEAAQAKFAAEEAKAKLEAAQAKLAAEEAQAKLAEVEAQLAARQEAAKPKTTRKRTTKPKETSEQEAAKPKTTRKRTTKPKETPEQEAAKPKTTRKRTTKPKETSEQEAAKPKTTRKRTTKPKESSVPEALEQEAQEAIEKKALEQETTEQE